MDPATAFILLLTLLAEFMIYLFLNNQLIQHTPMDQL